VFLGAVGERRRGDRGTVEQWPLVVVSSPILAHGSEPWESRTMMVVAVQGAPSPSLPLPFPDTFPRPRPAFPAPYARFVSTLPTGHLAVVPHSLYLLECLGLSLVTIYSCIYPLDKKKRSFPFPPQSRAQCSVQQPSSRSSQFCFHPAP